MSFFIKDFFSKCEEIRRKLRIWSHLLEKSLMKNLILPAMFDAQVLAVNYFRKNFHHRCFKDS